MVKQTFEGPFKDEDNLVFPPMVVPAADRGPAERDSVDFLNARAARALPVQFLKSPSRIRADPEPLELGHRASSRRTRFKVCAASATIASVIPFPEGRLRPRRERSSAIGKRPLAPLPFRRNAWRWRGQKATRDSIPSDARRRMIRAREVTPPGMRTVYIQYTLRAHGASAGSVTPSMSPNRSA